MVKMTKHASAVLWVVGLAAVTFGIARLQQSIFSAMSPKPAVAAPDIANPQKWSSIFSDEFNGTKLDSTKWATCYEWFDAQNNGCTNSGNDEQEWYVPDQVRVQNGQAIFTAEAKPVSFTSGGGQVTYPYRSGMISSGRETRGGQIKFEARYGYYEARMKFEGGRGVWPAFWLLPADGSWPPEIDVVEFLGHKHNEVLLTYHWGTSKADQKEDSSRISGQDFTEGWHVYAINWQPGKIEWYIDGILKKTVTGATITDKPMHLVLNLAVGGRLPGNPDSSTVFPRQLRVDYVRAYGMVL